VLVRARRASRQRSGMVSASASAISTAPIGITDWVNEKGTQGRLVRVSPARITITCQPYQASIRKKPITRVSATIRAGMRSAGGLALTSPGNPRCARRSAASAASAAP